MTERKTNYFESLAIWIEKRHNALYWAAIVIQIVGMIVTYSLYGISFNSDSPSYIEPAKNFLAYGLMQSEGSPIFFRTPGYILILAIIYKLTNMSNFAVVVVQALMSIATGTMIYSTVNSVSKSRSLSLGALFLWTACIMNYYYACCILTETSFVFFLIMSLMLGCEYLHKNKIRYAVSCFLCLNFSLLIRPAIMYYCIILGIFLLIASVLKKTSWKVTLIYLCIFAIAYGGWSFRNYYYFGAPLFTSIRYTSYYYWFAPETYRIAEKASSEEAYSFFPAQLHEQYPDYDKLSDLEQVYALAEIGRGYVKDHMGSFIILNLKGLGLEMIGPGKATIDELNLPRFLSLLLYMVSSSVALLVYLIYAAGFLRNFMRLQRLDWILFATNVYLMAGYAVLGYSRYRMNFFATCIIGAMICWRQDLLTQAKQIQNPS